MSYIGVSIDQIDYLSLGLVLLRFIKSTLMSIIWGYKNKCRHIPSIIAQRLLSNWGYIWSCLAISETIAAVTIYGKSFSLVMHTN